jgi:hypothetical protein
LRIPVRFPQAAPNLQPRDDIWPTDTAPVIRHTKGGFEFVQLRWGFPPARPKGAPIINFRSEGRRFPKGRCIVPAWPFGSCISDYPAIIASRRPPGTDGTRYAGYGAATRRR